MVEIAGIELRTSKDDDYYNEPSTVETYDEVRRTNPGGQYISTREESWLDRRLPDNDDATVLDVGGGTGWFTRYLENKGIDVTYLDQSPAMQQQASDRIKGPMIQGDATDMPFEDNSFDYAVSVRTAHIIDDDQLDDYINELTRVADTGVFFDTFRKKSLHSAYHRLLPMDSTPYNDTDVKNAVAPTDMDVEEHDRAFPIPYAAFMVAGSIDENGRLATPITSINNMLEETKTGKNRGTVSLWYLNSQ